MARDRGRTRRAGTVNSPCTEAAQMRAAGCSAFLPRRRAATAREARVPRQIRSTMEGPFMRLKRRRLISPPAVRCAALPPATLVDTLSEAQARSVGRFRRCDRGDLAGLAGRHTIDAPVLAPASTRLEGGRASRITGAAFARPTARCPWRSTRRRWRDRRRYSRDSGASRREMAAARSCGTAAICCGCSTNRRTAAGGSGWSPGTSDSMRSRGLVPRPAAPWPVEAPPRAARVRP